MDAGAAGAGRRTCGELPGEFSWDLGERLFSWRTERAREGGQVRWQVRTGLGRIQPRTARFGMTSCRTNYKTSLASSSAEEPAKLDIRGSSVESKVLFLRLSWKDMMG